MEFNKYRLKDIAKYKNERIETNQLTTVNYISTENLLPNKQGKQPANNLPSSKTVKKYTSSDILISNIRPYFKKIWQANSLGGHSNDVLNITSINEKISNDYLYYYLSQDKFFQYMTQTSKGTKMPRGDKEAIMEYEIKIPKNIVHQNFISSLGKSLDNKIEINKKIIANLEELSQTLFKRWFLDFEFPDEDDTPYKSSGGEMVDSELGEIPSDWKVGVLSDMTEIIMGQSPKSDTYNNNKVGLPLLNGASDFKNRNIKQTKYTSDPKKIGHNLDYVFGVRATIGLVTELDGEYAIGRGAGLSKNNEENREFIYEILNQAFTYFERIGSGSVYINISSKDLKQYKLIIPSKQVLMKYHYQLEPVFSELHNRKEQITSLTNLRDTLLPKLMSGEIEIPDDIEVNIDELSI